jgi:branched-chain amino acid transport system ATP-binding protein
MSDVIKNSARSSLNQQDSEPVLRTDDVTKRFGGLTAVDAVNIEVRPEYKIARAGIGRMFQETRIFDAMSVRKNLLLAAQKGDADIGQLLRRPNESLIARSDELLEYVDLGGLAETRAGQLSFGQQKLTEFIMELMAEPDLLLMDEPAGGINPSMLENLIEYIRAANEDEEATIFLIEHNMDFVMEVADRIYVLAHGERIAEGTPDEIQNNQRVLDAYLGRE